MQTYLSNLSILLITLWALVACTTSDLGLDSSQPPLFLTGTWKAQGLEEYEVWQTHEDGGYSGYAYRIKNGEKIIWEKMRISKQEGQWQLSVHVPEQNEGAAIVFKLQSDPHEGWLFVNPVHDFPKSILYRPVSATEWFADVRGDGNKGFSIVLEKQ